MKLVRTNAGSRRPSRLRVWAVLAAVLVVVATGLEIATAGTASADTPIDFDNLPTQTVLTNQYAATQGVTFATGGFQTVEVFADSNAHSGTNDLSFPCNGEACPSRISASFLSTQARVSVYVICETSPGFLCPTGISDQVEFQVFDASHNTLSDTTQAIGDTWTQLSFATAGNAATISSILLSQPGGGLPEYAIDDLSFGGATNQPDFALTPQDFNSTQGLGVPQGGSTTKHYTLHCLNGYTGTISYGYSAPTGVSLSISPSGASCVDGSTVTVVISATSQAPLEQGQSVTITADGSGLTPHTVSFPLTVQSVYQLRVQGIEITQGIQNGVLNGLPQRNVNNLSAPVAYNGATLIDQRPMAVRIFADAPSAPAGGVGAGIQLAGFNSSGNPLPGSPLDSSHFTSPEEGNTGQLTDSGPGFPAVPKSERDSMNGSFETLLPSTWTTGNLARLTATLLPAQSGFSIPTSVPCQTSACTTLGTMTMNGIPFVATGKLGLAVLTLNNNGSAPKLDFSKSSGVFSWTNLLPVTSVYKESDLGFMDIGFEEGSCTVSFIITESLCGGRSNQQSAILGFMWLARADGSHSGAGAGEIGITDQDYGVEDRSVMGAGSQPLAVVDENRPANDVDHEIGHMTGLQHASADCGGGSNGQIATSWPPDQHGYIDSIGLDINGSPPYQVVAGPGGPQDQGGCTPSQPPFPCGGASPQQYFDFMSYCTALDPGADGSLGSGNTWVSERNWNQMASFFSKLPSAQAGTRLTEVPRSSPLPPSGPMMRVLAETSSSGTNILSVDPTPSSAPAIGTQSSTFKVATTTSTGQVVSSTPLFDQHIHIDGDNGTQQILDAQIPYSASVKGVEIMSSGTKVASRPRPTTPPTVTLTQPGGSTCTTGGVPLHYKVTEAHPFNLTVSVDFSTDKGTTWKQVSEGSNTGSVTLARSSLATSTQAEVRIRANDGFNQTMKSSLPFCVADVPPTVSISSPTPKDIRGGATVALIGSASDGSGNPISDANLTWTANPGAVVLGKGSILTVTLPAKVSSVTLKAQDSTGKTATAKVSSPITPLSLINGWTNAPYGTNNAGVTENSGVVSFQGAIATSGSNTVAFVLPTQFRPTTNVYVPVDLCNSTKGRLSINPSGVVTVEAENNALSDAECFTSLDGASFVQTSLGVTPLSLQNGWTNTPFGTNSPGVTEIGGVVRFQGAMSTSGTNPGAFTLPSGLAPATNVYVPVDLCGAANGRLDIAPSGQVSVEAQTTFSNAQCFTSLDGASYVLTSSGVTPLSLQPGWATAPFGFNDPGAIDISGVVSLRGAISTAFSSTNPDPSAPVFVLPPQLAPATEVYVPVDLTGAGNGRLRISPNGDVFVEVEINSPFSNAEAFTSLEGVSFVR